ncbi:hypothetical protein D3C78_898330 [compost metagenome]
MRFIVQLLVVNRISVIERAKSKGNDEDHNERNDKKDFQLYTHIPIRLEQVSASLAAFILDITYSEAVCALFLQICVIKAGRRDCLPKLAPPR